MTSVRAIIDSGVWIGARYQNDQYRKKALAIVDAFINKQIKEVHLTDYVLVETINFLLRKEGYETASEALDSFLESERVIIRYVDKMMLMRIRELGQRYKGLSLTDCSLIALAEETGVNDVFSFDSAFDKVRGLQRREERR